MYRANIENLPEIFKNYFITLFSAHNHKIKLAYQENFYLPRVSNKRFPKPVKHTGDPKRKKLGQNLKHF